jgi:hypothetical protein
MVYDLHCFFDKIREYMEVFKLFNVPFVYEVADACSDHYEWIDFSILML